MWLQKNKEIISRVCFLSFLLYFLETLSSYADWFPGSTRLFVYTSTTGIILRMFVSLLLIGSAFLVFVSNYERINKKWFIVVGVMILFELLSLSYTPMTYDVLFKTGQVYTFMAYRHISVSIKEALIFSFSQSVDLLFGLLFLIILPLVLSKKRLFFILNFFNAIVLYSILYSLLKERSYYIYFLKGDWKYQNTSIGSIFGNKQQWGIFLVAAFCSAVYSVYLLLYKKELRRTFKALIISFYSLFALSCVACCTVAFCKTGIVCFLSFVLLFLVFASFKLCTKRKTMVIGCLCFLVLIGGVVATILFNTVESLRNNVIGKLVYNVFHTLENTSGNSISVRFALVYALLEKFPAINLLFGMPKGVLDAYVRTVSPELIVGLHTGIVVYFGRTGIFGLVVYIFLLSKLIKIYFRVAKMNPTLSFIYISFFIISVIMNLSEAEILIFSSSMNGLILNLILVTDAVNKMEESKNESKNFYICYC